MKLNKRETNKTSYTIMLTAIAVMVLSLSACGGASSGADVSSPSASQQAQSGESAGASPKEEAPREKGSRDNTPVCLVPVASGETVYENAYARLDASNCSEGYVVVSYLGSSPKVKLQITGPTQITYTYNLTTTAPTEEVFPLQSGDGEYMINVFENIEGTQYSQAFSQEISVKMPNEFSPFLYPNQYVNFESSSSAVKKGADLAYVCNSDLEVVSEVYNYIIGNISYDYDEAETVQSGYLPDIDEVLESKKGICLDYAALMTSILRSQKIPTRMEVGYAGSVYHAWLSTYIEDIGWVNGMIEFNGTDWELMDPTFASNTNDKSLKDFIGDGSNYSVKYIY